jgi:hypothetical protein
LDETAAERRRRLPKANVASKNKEFCRCWRYPIALRRRPFKNIAQGRGKAGSEFTQTRAISGTIGRDPAYLRACPDALAQPVSSFRSCVTGAARANIAVFDQRSERRQYSHGTHQTAALNRGAKESSVFSVPPLES